MERTCDQQNHLHQKTKNELTFSLSIQNNPKKTFFFFGSNEGIESCKHTRYMDMFVIVKFRFSALYS